MRRPTAHLCVMVWGAPFIEKFARTTLACLLSPGNLPAIRDGWDVVVHAFTDQESAPLLDPLLSPLGDVQLHLFNETTVRGRTLGEWMSKRTGPAIKHEINILACAHTMEACLSAGPNDVVIITDNDFLIANGTLSNCLAQISAGAKVCVFPVLRIMTTDPVKAIMAESAGKEGVTASQIVDLLPLSFHPTTRSCLVSEQAFSTYPSQILWPTDEGGFLCRAFFPAPVVIKPCSASLEGRQTPDYDLALRTCSNMNNIYLPRTSEDGLICKVSDISYNGPALDQDGVSLGLLTHFILGGTNCRHRDLIAKPMRIGPDKATEAAWLAIEDQSLAQLGQAYDLLDRVVKELPSEDQELMAAKKAHFGSLDDFASV